MDLQLRALDNWDLWWPGGVTLGVLSGLFAWTRSRTNEAGLGAFAIAFGLGASLYLVKSQLLPDRSHVSLAGLAMTVTIAILMAKGLCDFTHTEKSPSISRLSKLVGAWLIGTAVIFLAHPGDPFDGHFSLSLLLLFLSAISWRVSRIEPGVGFVAISIAFLSYPLACAYAWSAGWPEVRLRLVFWIPLNAVGVLLLIAATLRARDRLDALHQALERKVKERTQDLEQVVDGLESFNRMVSHDLRSPLAGITGLASLAILAADRGEIPATKRYLGLIEQQGNASAEMVTALLELAQVGRQELTRQPVALEQSVKRAITQICLAREDAHRVKFVVAELPQIQADQRLVNQVFVNLISNAVKFSSKLERPAVEIGMSDSNTVFVKDNGVGFDSSTSKLFEPFRRLHGSMFEGTGIGLTIVRKIVEHHGGTIRCESRPGDGATFYFTLTAPV